MDLHQWIGIIFAGLGTLSITFGIIGLYKYDNFYVKATVSSLIDSTGFLLVALGIIIYMGLSYFSLKTLLLLFLIWLLNPLANHYIVRGAHTSGYHPGKEK